MIRAIKLSNFTIKYRDFEGNKDYNLILEFDVNSAEESIFGSGRVQISIPMAFGLFDTSVTSDMYECVVLVDVIENATASSYDILFAFFRKKLIRAQKMIEPQEPAVGAQVLDSVIEHPFRGIRSPTGQSYINIGDNIIELVSGQNKLTVSGDKISFYGDLYDFNLPSKSQGGLFKESGILRFLPKSFVPPFALPDYLPDISTISKVASMSEIVSNFMKSFGGG